MLKPSNLFLLLILLKSLKVKVMTLCNPMDIQSMEFSRPEYWSELPFPSPVDLPNPGIDPASTVFPALAGKFLITEPPGKEQEVVTD